MIGKVFFGCALLACVALAGVSASTRTLTERQAEEALHYGYRLLDESSLNELSSEVTNAEAAVAGLEKGANELSIAVARDRAAAARFRFELEKRGHPLLLEDCLGLGKSVRVGHSDAYSAFRCRISSLAKSRYVRKTIELTASELVRLAAVPRSASNRFAWRERVMADRLLTFRLSDPAFVRGAREDVRSAESQLAELRADGSDQRSIDAAVARVQNAMDALRSAERGEKLRSASCLGIGTPRVTGSRKSFVSFRCRISAVRSDWIQRAFVAVEVRSPTSFRVTRITPLAPLT